MKAKCLIINCMDPRVQEGLIKLTQKKNCFGEYYLVSVKGSSSYFHNGREEDLLNMISLSKVKTVLIIHHSDCKAYDIKYPTIEKKTQITDMIESEKIIKGIFPNIRVIKLWAELDEFKTSVATFQEISG